MSSRIGRQRRLQQALWQYDARAKAGTVGSMAAFANPIESVTGRDYPGIGGRSLQVLAEVLKDGRVGWRNGRKVVERFINTRGQTRCCDVVSQNPTIDYLRKKRCRRHQFGQG